MLHIHMNISTCNKSIIEMTCVYLGEYYQQAMLKNHPHIN